MARLSELVTDILSVSQDEAMQLLKQHPQDAEGLYNALIFAPRSPADEGGLSELISQKWRNTTMALLPERDCIPFVGSCPDAFVINQSTLGNRGSLRHVSLHKLDYGEGFDPAHNRMVLLNELRSKVPAQLLQEFWPLVGLLSESNRSIDTARLAAYPHNDDLRLIRLADFLELKFNHCKHQAETMVRAQCHLPDDTPTPIKHFPVLAKMAYASALNDWTQITGSRPKQATSDNAENAPGNLILQVMLNICANRQLLERARQQALAATAEEANIAFLKALNKAGIYEINAFEFSGQNAKWSRGSLLYAVYSDCLDWDLPEYEAALGGKSLLDCTRAGLVAQFGPGTRWAESLDCRPLQGFDLEWVMNLAERCHHHLHNTRLSGRSASYITWHTAVMAVVAAWHSKPSVQKLQAPSDRPISAFPVRNSGPNWEPTAEHLALYSLMAGQLLYGNQGRSLRADSVASYAKAFDHYHAATQGLFMKVLKRGSPHELLYYAHSLDMDKWM